MCGYLNSLKHYNSLVRTVRKKINKKQTTSKLKCKSYSGVVVEQPEKHPVYAFPIQLFLWQRDTTLTKNKSEG